MEMEPVFFNAIAEIFSMPFYQKFLENEIVHIAQDPFLL